MLRTPDSFGPQRLATAPWAGKHGAREEGGSHYSRFGHSARPKPTRPKLKIISYLPPSTRTRPHNTLTHTRALPG